MNKVKGNIKKYSIYYISVVVFIFSFVLAYSINTTEILKGIITLPAVGSLVSILYKIWIDNLAHERIIKLQNKQQDFILGATSHIADIAYNKHVKFCEEYINRIQRGFQELLKDGPSKNSIDIGRELVNIRQKHSAWLTKEIENKLKPFEQALINIGAKEHYLEISRLPTGEERTKVVDEIYRSFGLILGHEKSLNEEEANLHIDKIIEHIREILGINTLTKLRLRATELALERLDS